ncbi:hypothetical protein INT48_004452 [Thamnidium elegans]|uniref:Uncharacterized protein n=1 Tax=Thamnidium elegans TaxID=101142 RepID=A0A8H7SKB1_9FUNG|nr:hypothetical protein INT48_004452 [Thamnidium elegans]
MTDRVGQPDQQLITYHIYFVHGYVLNGRSVVERRPLERRDSFEESSGGDWDVEHFGCPSFEGFVTLNSDEEDEEVGSLQQIINNIMAVMAE